MVPRVFRKSCTTAIGYRTWLRCRPCWCVAAAVVLCCAVITKPPAFGNADASSADDSAVAAGAANTAEAAAAPHPSQVLFQEIFGPLQNTAPTERNYERIFVQIRDLCDKYPGSAPAMNALHAVGRWAKEGLVSQEAAAPLLAYFVRFNPAKDRLKVLEDKCKEAIVKDDLAALKEASAELEEIAAAHPGTLSEFLARSNLAPLYDRLGETKKSQEAAADFLQKYPPGATNYPTYEGYLYNNLFLYASGLSKTESVDRSLEAYNMIAGQFAKKPMFAVPALYDSGMMNLQNERYDAAIKLFTTLSASYPADFDSRVVLARFRIIEALLGQGKEKEAEAAAEELYRTLKGGNWEHQATRIRDWVLVGRKQKDAPRDALATAEAPDSPPERSSTARTWLLAANVIVVAGMLAVVGRKYVGSKNTH